MINLRELRAASDEATLEIKDGKLVITEPLYEFKEGDIALLRSDVTVTINSKIKFKPCLTLVTVEECGPVICLVKDTQDSFYIHKENLEPAYPVKFKFKPGDLVKCKYSGSEVCKIKEYSPGSYRTGIPTYNLEGGGTQIEDSLTKCMKNSNYIKNLLNKKENTDSIKEKRELEFTICKWCYDMIKTISNHENSIEGFDKSLSIFKEHYDLGAPENYDEYSCNEETDDLGNIGIRIYHAYIWGCEAQLDSFFIPFYVLDDIEDGLKKYHEDNIKEYQEQLRTSIFNSLQQIKNKFKKLKDIPDDFKKIIDNDLWDLI